MHNQKIHKLFVMLVMCFRSPVNGIHGDVGLC